MFLKGFRRLYNTFTFSDSSPYLRRCCSSCSKKRSPEMVTAGKKSGDDWHRDLYNTGQGSLGPLETPSPRFPLPGQVGIASVFDVVRPVVSGDGVGTTTVSMFESLVYSIERRVNDWTRLFAALQVWLSINTRMDESFCYPRSANYLALKLFLPRSGLAGENGFGDARSELLLSMARVSLIVKQILHQCGFSTFLQFRSEGLNEDTQFPGHFPVQLLQSNQALANLCDSLLMLGEIKKVICTERLNAVDEPPEILRLSDEFSSWLKPTIRQHVVVRIVTTAPIGKLLLTMPEFDKRATEK